MRGRIILHRIVGAYVPGWCRSWRDMPAMLSLTGTCCPGDAFFATPVFVPTRMRQ